MHRTAGRSPPTPFPQLAYPRPGGGPPGPGKRVPSGGLVHDLGGGHGAPTAGESLGGGGEVALVGGLVVGVQAHT